MAKMPTDSVDRLEVLPGTAVPTKARRGNEVPAAASLGRNWHRRSIWQVSGQALPHTFA